MRLHIVVDLSQRRVFLRRDGRVIWRAPVAIGAPGTPTPVGRFAVAERIMTRTPNGFLGPVVFPLTGYSRTLNEYAGGNGRIAIHGTSLPELIGTRASHGCIRLRADVRRLSRLVRRYPGPFVRSNRSTDGSARHSTGCRPDRSGGRREGCRSTPAPSARWYRRHMGRTPTPPF